MHMVRVGWLEDNGMAAAVAKILVEKCSFLFLVLNSTTRGSVNVAFTEQISKN